MRVLNLNIFAFFWDGLYSAFYFSNMLLETIHFNQLFFINQRISNAMKVVLWAGVHRRYAAEFGSEVGLAECKNKIESQ